LNAAFAMSVMDLIQNIVAQFTVSSSSFSSLSFVFILIPDHSLICKWSFKIVSFYGVGLLTLCPTPSVEEQDFILGLASISGWLWYA
jgi:hypothetical protein